MFSLLLSFVATTFLWLAIFMVALFLVRDLLSACIEIHCLAYDYGNPNQNTPGVKKVAAKNLKKGHAEKDVKSKWAAKASCC